MARRSLSSQVLEESDRAIKALSSVQDSVEPLVSVLLDQVQESLHRVQGMCLRAQQEQTNSILREEFPASAVRETADTEKPTRRRSATHRAPSTRKAGY